MIFGVLVVDDSDFTREALRRALETNPSLQVVGEARTGEEAVEQARRLRPHLVTMDLSMPGMGGLKALELIMKERPVPVVVISEKSADAGKDLNYEAISRGAVELVPKSEVFGGAELGLRRFADQMRQLAEAGVSRPKLSVEASRPKRIRGPEAPLLVGLGASAGGPRALAQVLASLAPAFPVPIVIVQHMAEDFFDSFVRFLNDRSKVKVVRAEHGMKAAPGCVYLGAPRQHLTIDRTLHFKRVAPATVGMHCPSVDALFSSMADALRGRAVGVLMTGMGSDGARGLLALKRSGARTAVQDAATCSIAGMPQSAIELDAAEDVVPLNSIAGWLTEETRPEAVRTGSSKKKILIVDDSKLLLDVGRLALEEAGYEVRTLENPLMVAMQLRREPVDLVLLDVNMPTVKGTQVVEVLRAHGLNSTPVILYSDLDETLLETKARQCGATGWLRKTGDGEALLEAIAHWLGTS